MKHSLILSLALLASLAAVAEEKTVSSPDGKVVVTLANDAGRASYRVSYGGQPFVLPSALGLNTSYGDFTQHLTLTGAEVSQVSKEYDLTRSKVSHVKFQANQLEARFQNADGNEMRVRFVVADNDVAFKYILVRPKKGNPKNAIVYSEATSFNLPDGTTTFLTPQIQPMTGWEDTKPSYEEEYVADAPMSQKSQYGVGYTFPCLFKNGDKGWLQVSETGVTSDYCGSRLADWQAGRGYQVAYPQEGENNGLGSAAPAINLLNPKLREAGMPGETPWRTITLGTTLKPIVETTIQFDVVDPLYEPKYDYKPGRYTWSWLIWQDNSVNYADQVRFIDLAAKMGYEYCLVDGLWDAQIGYEGIERLAAYARQKGVSLMLWYNSNGYENNAPQGPRGVMNNSINRKRDMAWMQKIGVKGIKVDFFGGDKQETMRLYEEILSDANDYGIAVIFHGCTLPRGWERMYPNYISSEACLASENVFFTDHHARREGFEMSMHPFSRNAVGSFDWGGVIMNRYLSQDNKSRHQRYTSDVFEMATAITNQAYVNCVEVTPNVVDSLPAFETDFLKAIPTAWDETRFIDGYPGRYAVIARRVGTRWYVGGINGTDQPMRLTLDLPMLAGQTVAYYLDQPKKKGQLWPDSRMSELKVSGKGQAKVTIQPMGGIILVQPIGG